MYHLLALPVVCCGLPVIVTVLAAASGASQSMRAIWLTRIRKESSHTPRRCTAQAAPDGGRRFPAGASSLCHVRKYEFEVNKRTMKADSIQSRFTNRSR